MLSSANANARGQTKYQGIGKNHDKSGHWPTTIGHCARRDSLFGGKRVALSKISGCEWGSHYKGGLPQGCARQASILHEDLSHPVSTKHMLALMNIRFEVLADHANFSNQIL